MSEHKSLCNNKIQYDLGFSSMVPATLKHPRKMTPSDSWRDLLLWGQRELEVLGPQEAEASAASLLEELSGLKGWQIRLKTEEKPEAPMIEKYRSWVGQRKQRVPTAYVTGKAFFRDEVLDVGPECLVPRPETELLVEAVIKGSAFEALKKFEFLDLGTGSGAIAISLLRFFSNAQAVMADISTDALRRAGGNAERYGLAGRFAVVHTDFFSAFQKLDSKKTWPVIVSNPPYLAADDWKSVEPELLHEPRLALDGGNDGLDAYRIIAREAGSFLETRGMLFLEVGQGQAPSVRGLLAEQKFTDIHILKDFSGIDRIVTARKGLHG
jgi:release factor glutamine methyltransferase